MRNNFKFEAFKIEDKAFKIEQLPMLNIQYCTNAEHLKLDNLQIENV